jgi:DnaJ-class molecular chaperone
MSSDREAAASSRELTEDDSPVPWCRTCHGAGVVLIQHYHTYRYEPAKCPTCKGEGLQPPHLRN